MLGERCQWWPLSFCLTKPDGWKCHSLSRQDILSVSIYIYFSFNFQKQGEAYKEFLKILFTALLKLLCTVSLWSPCWFPHLKLYILLIPSGWLFSTAVITLFIVPHLPFLVEWKLHKAGCLSLVHFCVSRTVLHQQVLSVHEVNGWLPVISALNAITVARPESWQHTSDLRMARRECGQLRSPQVLVCVWPACCWALSGVWVLRPLASHLFKFFHVRVWDGSVNWHESLENVWLQATYSSSSGREKAYFSGSTTTQFKSLQKRLRKLCVRFLSFLFCIWKLCTLFVEDESGLCIMLTVSWVLFCWVLKSALRIYFFKIQLLVTLKKIIVILVCPVSTFWRLSSCAFLRYQYALGCFRDLCELAEYISKGQKQGSTSAPLSGPCRESVECYWELSTGSEEIVTE